jgi:Ca2+-binding RTX toxin-like protein
MSLVASWFRSAARHLQSLGGKSAKQKRVRIRPSVGTGLEKLEERSLLSVLFLSDGTATYTASNSVVNNLTISIDGANYVFLELGSTSPGGLADNITVAGSGSAGCVGNGTTLVTCPVANITVGIVASLGDLNDSLQVNGSTVPVTASGGAGNDVLAGAPNVVNTLNGNQGNDTLTGGNLGDTLDGGEGNDVLNAGAGDDVIVGDSGSDTMNGGAGIDRADYSNSPVGVTVNLVTGKAKGAGDLDPVTGKTKKGNDLITGVENVRGSNFNDRITGNELNNRLEGLGGNDKLNGGSGDDRLIGGEGNDVLSGADGNDLLGENNDDPALVTEFEPGKDRISGGDGNDTLRGGVGNDSMTGGLGDDSLRGGAGDDTMTGNNGTDAIFGDEGFDTLFREPKDTVDFGPQ